MKYTVEIAATAKQDILDIYYFLYEQKVSKQIIETQIGKIESGIYTLAELPERYPLSDIVQLKALGIRKMVVGR